VAQAQKPDFVFHRNGRVNLNRRGRQFSRLLAVEQCGSVGSDSIIFSEYADRSLKMSPQGGKKRLKRSGEREKVYVNKFMKTESEVGITIRVSKVQKRVTEATRVSRRTLCRVLKDGENAESGVAIACSTPRKLKTKLCTKSIFDTFDEAVLRIVHNFHLAEKERQTLKAIRSKICKSTGYGRSVSSLRLILRKIGFR
jgi:hypothetical protein